MPCPLCGGKDIAKEASPEYPHANYADVVCIHITLLCKDKKCGWSWDMIGSKQINIPKKSTAV